VAVIRRVGPQIAITLRHVARQGAGLLLVLGAGTACAQVGAPAATRSASVTNTAPAASSSAASSSAALSSAALSSAALSTVTDSSTPMIWTAMDGAGQIRHPASWHAFPLPLGVTPGAHIVLALSTGTTSPCRWQTSGSTAKGTCWSDRLPAGGVEIILATQLPSRPLPPARTWSVATATCAGLGGTRSLAATLTLPRTDPGQHGLVVTACLADPGGASNQRHVNAMLDSLRP